MSGSEQNTVRNGMYLKYFNDTRDAVRVPTRKYYDEELKTFRLAIRNISKFKSWFTTGGVPDRRKIRTTGTSF